MCLEDLMLGRGRFLKGPTISTNTAAATMQADASRVAVIVSLRLAAYYDTSVPGPKVDTAFVRFSGSLADASSISIGGGTSVFVMRIEDYGNAITGPITISCDNQSGNALVTLAAICTEVNAPPLDTYKP